jgi:hypothetical protein
MLQDKDLSAAGKLLDVVQLRVELQFEVLSCFDVIVFEVELLIVLEKTGLCMVLHSVLVSSPWLTEKVIFDSNNGRSLAIMKFLLGRVSLAQAIPRSRLVNLMTNLIVLLHQQGASLLLLHQRLSNTELNVLVQQIAVF